ncbi:MAG: hypothetical protein AAB903_03810 [Patescibacteria group bacterium]
MIPFLSSQQLLDACGLFLMMAGFIIGLGAVTIIDIHGFLARKSPHWTEATTHAHKVTKPLIWVGIFLAILGGTILYRDQALSGIPLVHAAVALVLVMNSCFVSFAVNPFLLKKEREGKGNELLSQSWQRKIMISLIVSDIGWWGSLVLFVLYIAQRF